MRGCSECVCRVPAGWKRDIALDLKQPDGQRIALELVATADVVHHNMTLGTADRLGVGYDDCRAVRPDVVYCNTYMYRATGPLAHMGGLDPPARAGQRREVGNGIPRSGIATARATSPPPSRRSTACSGGALMHRQRTGEGQLVRGRRSSTGRCSPPPTHSYTPDGTPSVRPQLQGRGVHSVLPPVRDRRRVASGRRRQGVPPGGSARDPGDRLRGGVHDRPGDQLAAAAPPGRRAGRDLGGDLGRRVDPVRRRAGAARAGRRVRASPCWAQCASSAT